jgi:hypothetical protein
VLDLLQLALETVELRLALPQLVLERAQLLAGHHVLVVERVQLGARQQRLPPQHRQNHLVPHLRRCTPASASWQFRDSGARRYQGKKQPVSQLAIDLRTCMQCKKLKSTTNQAR